jgi:hypothetical protein
MGMLAYHVAHAGQPAEAIRIAEAACDVARQTSIGMQARVAGRLATAHAAAGDIHSFRAAADRARTLLARRRSKAIRRRSITYRRPSSMPKQDSRWSISRHATRATRGTYSPKRSSCSPR